MAYFPEDFVYVELLKDKELKNIGECAGFLEKGSDTLFTPRDIWTRLLRELANLDVI